MALTKQASNLPSAAQVPSTLLADAPAEYDVAVVGAGLAGSSIAAQLATAGWRVLLLERDEFPRHKVCGEFLSPEVQQTLYALNLYQPVVALQPVALQRATITGRRGKTLTIALPGTAWGLSRYALDATLAATAVARGATLQSGSTLISYGQNHAGYGLVVRTSDQRRVAINARALIMACGRHTAPGLPPRERAAAARAQGWRRCVGIKVHYADILMPPQTELYLLPGGYVGINPIEGGRANLCALLSYDTFAQAGRQIDAAVKQMIRWNGALAERLADAVPVAESRCTVAPVDTERRALPWDGVACLGDTAAMIPPLCGDGMAMALQTAALCAPLADEFLRGRRTLVAWQQRYSQEWHGAFDTRLRVGRALQTVLGWPQIGDLMLDLGHVMPSLATYLMRATRGGGSSTIAISEARS